MGRFAQYRERLSPLVETDTSYVGVHASKLEGTYCETTGARWCAAIFDREAELGAFRVSSFAA